MCGWLFFTYFDDDETRIFNTFKIRLVDDYDDITILFNKKKKEEKKES